MGKNSEFSHGSILRKNGLNLLKGTLSLLAVDVVLFSLPYLVKLMIDRLRGEALPTWFPAYWGALSPLPFVLSLCCLYLTAAACIAFGRYWWRVYLVWSTFPWFHERRHRLFEHIQSLDRNFFQTHKIGDLLSTLTTDTENMRMTVSIGALMAIDAAINFLLFPIILYNLNATLALTVVPPLLIISFLAILLTEKLSKYYSEVQERTATLSGKAFELFSGIRIIKAFRRESALHADFSKESRKLKEASQAVSRYQSLFVPGLDFALSMALCFVLVYGGLQVLEHRLPLSNLIAFQLYLANLSWPMMAIGWFIQMYRPSKASEERILDLANNENALKTYTSATLASFGPDDPTFALRGLSFRYSNQKTFLFQNLELRFSSAQWIGLTGPVGCGKSTFLELLSRQRDPVEGEILFDGKNLRALELSWIRNHILYVPQETFIFSRSFRSNLSLNSVAEQALGDEILWHLLADLAFDRTALESRGGLEMKLGERGADLSGGQRQRLAIGRALLRERQVYLLDDIFSHVDSETEAKLVQVLKAHLPKTALVILVSQRIETLRACHQIAVLNAEGKLEYFGNQKEAVAQSAFMAALDRLQQFGNDSIGLEVQ